MLDEQHNNCQQRGAAVELRAQMITKCWKVGQGLVVPVLECWKVGQGLVVPVLEQVLDAQYECCMVVQLLDKMFKFKLSGTGVGLLIIKLLNERH